ncbi:N-acetylgalactosamine kinase-like [Halichondria panicea]|uniref:N-acetylgalactosamine kinase-like n=1 Tax=Halichondria panicea TaxID=6063 RepID=UPI00312B4CEE
MAETPAKKPSSDPPPVFSSLDELSQGSETNAKRYQNLVQAFKTKYGTEPQFIARAPGRVNIIGEHIDYSGYAVLPMAIELDIAIACRTRNEDVINISNTNPKYLDHQSNINRKLNITKRGMMWYDYILCGIAGAEDYCNIDNLTGMDLLVDGNIPPASGLSSSSALVCCSALATAHANKIALPSKAFFAEMCAKCERYIGTEGGGMDQAISFLGEQGKAMMIEFDPIRTTEVKIPKGCVFVIANTLVPAEKATAASCFNVRVAECRLASLVMAYQLGVKRWEEVRKLLTLEYASGHELKEIMTKVVTKHLRSDPYTQSDLCSIMDVDKQYLWKEFLNEQTKSIEEFQLYYRVEHVYNEASRVYQFKDIANDPNGENVAVKLGKLMDDSHASCRDLYECSCPELDQIVAIAKSAGSLGSRLTGAGWGGCTVSLVREDKCKELMETLQEEYYKGHSNGMENLDASLFVTKPGPGAALCVF